ncbi:folylpolyglutamate synthase 1 isoform X1 [Ptiloglossa arizonensis]|uniref:folylpolyglutamate synthase 1 isoform X1 n=2 Tax=Ptiloglossa arizonensis TaxID=3350558 RepID=UPI003FA003D1
MEQKVNHIMYYNYSYENALDKLQNLESNAKYLELAKKKNINRSIDMQKYLLRSDITLEKLDTLSVIHVAGTKGKGSTCAYVEAILREHGFKTGFFSSPHLVTVNERIRINGQPISKLDFAQYFSKIYKKLEETKEHEFDMPSYFKFLTLLMFDIFLDINVDVAIIEVGIGGLLDSTNVVRNPVCVGITSLALEHTSLLGNTIEDIAFQKSGIFKPNTLAFSVPQVPQAMHVLEKKAIQVACNLHVVPDFKEYKWKNLSPVLKIKNTIQQQNASLAIQIAIAWLISNNNKCLPLVYNTINDNNFCNKYKEYIQMMQQTQKSEIVSMDRIAMGLLSCKWPGRMHVVRNSIAEFFIDGAHTIESIECCINWFNDVSNNTGKGKRILIFNTSGCRDSIPLLTPLKSLNFYKAYFVPNFSGIDNENDRYTRNQTKFKCEENLKIWGVGSVVANSVLEVLEEIKKDFKKELNCSNDQKFQVLVTGSLHLAGAVCSILDPNLTMNTEF